MKKPEQYHLKYNLPLQALFHNLRTIAKNYCTWSIWLCPIPQCLPLIFVCCNKCPWLMCMKNASISGLTIIVPSFSHWAYMLCFAFLYTHCDAIIAPITLSTLFCSCEQWQLRCCLLQGNTVLYSNFIMSNNCTWDGDNLVEEPQCHQWGTYITRQLWMHAYKLLCYIDIGMAST